MKRKDKNLFFFFSASAIVGSLLFSILCLGDQAQPPSKNTKRTNVDFEDQLVQGEVKKPELFYLLQKKQFNFGKLIKLRENFVPEMSKTAEDIEKSK